MPEHNKMGYNRQHNVPESFTIKQQSALKSQYGTLKLTTTVEQTRCEAAERVLPVIADMSVHSEGLRILQVFVQFGFALPLLLCHRPDG